MGKAKKRKKLDEIDSDEVPIKKKSVVNVESNSPDIDDGNTSHIDSTQDKKKKKAKKKKDKENDCNLDLEVNEESVVKVKKHKKSKKTKHRESKTDCVDSDVENSDKYNGQEVKSSNEKSKVKKHKKSKKIKHRESIADTVDVNVENSEKHNKVAAVKSSSSEGKETEGDKLKTSADAEEKDASSGSDNEDEGETAEKRRIKEKKRLKRKLKKEAKDKQREQQKSGEVSYKAQTAAVEYLRLWRDDRDRWNFQKVPDEDFPALLEYLEGLKGKARELTVSKAEDLLKSRDKEENDTEASETAEAKDQHEKGSAEAKDQNEKGKTEEADKIKNVDEDRLRQVIQLLS